jgi:hypothetical protein
MGSADAREATGKSRSVTKRFMEEPPERPIIPLCPWTQDSIEKKITLRQRDADPLLHCAKVTDAVADFTRFAKDCEQPCFGASEALS